MDNFPDEFRAEVRERIQVMRVEDAENKFLKSWQLPVIHIEDMSDTQKIREAQEWRRRGELGETLQPPRFMKRAEIILEWYRQDKGEALRDDRWNRWVPMGFKMETATEIELKTRLEHGNRIQQGFPMELSMDQRILLQRIKDELERGAEVARAKRHSHTHGKQ
jgi:hypothetical protein